MREDLALFMLNFSLWLHVDKDLSVIRDYKILAQVSIAFHEVTPEEQY